MRNEQNFLKSIRHTPAKGFFERPFQTRRHFFRVLGAGIAGSAILGRPAIGQDLVQRSGAATLGKAKNTVMVLLAGAPSHVDTFDFKETPDSPMNLLAPETIGDIRWPTGLMPKLASNVPDMAIVRSVRPWALQHNLSQAWVQIGRSPAGALGDIAPNIGTIVAIEKEPERQKGQVFPSFLALNSGAGVGAGYLSADFAPFKIDPAAAGLPDTINPDSPGADTTRFDNKYALLMDLDKPLRTPANIYGKEMGDYHNFYENGKAMMYNQSVNQAFRFTQDEAAKYGSTGFGNACLTTAKVLAARGGTRYVQITLGSWDHHNTIYSPNTLPAMCRQLDNGLSQMIKDLKASGMWDETLLVVMGEFGRTTGKLTGTAGRDHWSQQFAMLAGAGIQGGRAIGKTDDAGADTVEAGWSRDRYVRFEDIESTIYSAMGIDWTSVRYDDPFKRGFYYVPESNNDVYGPINELWG
ncbi:MAG: DUF1501 domain-containing protein [Bryobacteraceae bacterium]